MMHHLIIILFFLLTAGCAVHKQSKQDDPAQLHQAFTGVDTLIPLQKNADDQNVHIQFLEGMLTYKNISTMATEMAIQMAAMQGASLANAHITSQGQMLSEKINRDSQTIQTNMQSFQNKSQTDQQKNLQSMVTAFSDAQRDVQTQTKQAQDISTLEIDYLYQNISIDQPQQNYIFNQIQFDQLFTLGTMMTPQGRVWKNPFSVGDWQYDKDTKSFWQYQSSPLFNDIQDDDGKTTKSSLQAENNSIFTEYYTNQSQYTLAGTITIYRFDHPAFVGILCNKSRWISGDFQAIRKSRLFGIYATSPTESALYITQQYTMTDEQIKADPSGDIIQTPLQQIIHNKTEKKIALPADLFANIELEPVVCHFTIINSPTKMTCTLACQNKEPLSYTVDTLDSDLFMHHGVGFISPGAVAQFLITEPHDLLFSDQAILNFKD